MQCVTQVTFPIHTYFRPTSSCMISFPSVEVKRYNIMGHVVMISLAYMYERYVRLVTLSLLVV